MRQRLSRSGSPALWQPPPTLRAGAPGYGAPGYGAPGYGGYGPGYGGGPWGGNNWGGPWGGNNWGSPWGGNNWGNNWMPWGGNNGWGNDWGPFMGDSDGSGAFNFGMSGDANARGRGEGYGRGYSYGGYGPYGYAPYGYPMQPGMMPPAPGEAPAARPRQAPAAKRRRPSKAPRLKHPPVPRRGGRAHREVSADGGSEMIRPTRSALTRSFADPGPCRRGCRRSRGTDRPAAGLYGPRGHQLPDGTECRRGVVVKDGPDMRLEYTENGRQVVQIIRRAEGIMYMLDPAQQSYFEVRGEPSPDPTGVGYMPPCEHNDPTISCTLKGTEITSGITAEVWEIARPGPAQVSTILWDGARHRALRQTFPDGIGDGDGLPGDGSRSRAARSNTGHHGQRPGPGRR